jgi:ubiquinone/menaquinone biosynthesis C-methylase UbiE
MIVYDIKAAQDTERSYLTPEIIQQRSRTLDALALQAGEQVLDAGCGTGLLLEQMAISVGDNGRAVGVDYSPDMLDMARHRCQGLGNVELQQGSVEQLDFESDSFDVVSCTQTLLYVEQVETALEEIHRVLKPHGRVAILETDWRGVVFNSLDESMTRRILTAWDDAVESPNLPVRLGKLLRELNFSAIRVKAIPILNSSDNGNNFSSGMLKGFAKNAVKHNAITQQESDQWQQQVQELVQQNAYFFCVNRFLFTAVK